MNPLSDKELERLEARYGRVRQLSFTVGNVQRWYVIRKPSFNDYVTFNKNVTNLSPPGQPAKFELDPEVAGFLLKNLIVHPEDIDVTSIPPGFIVDACVHAINLYEFEDADKVKSLYLQSLKHAHSIVGILVQRLVSMYGIQGYTIIKDLPENEIMDLLVYTEMINGDLGALSGLLGMNLPMITKGKKSSLDVKQILGTEQAGQPSSVLSQREQVRRRQMEQHFANLKYTPEQIAEIMNRKDRRDPIQAADQNKPASDKIDMHNMSESEIASLDGKTYAKLKKDGKLTSFQDSQRTAISNSHDVLLHQIQQDKETYGESNNRKFTGDLKSLLRDINSKTKTMD